MRYSGFPTLVLSKSCRSWQDILFYYLDFGQKSSRLYESRKQPIGADFLLRLRQGIVIVAVQSATTPLMFSQRQRDSLCTFWTASTFIIGPLIPSLS